MVNISLEHLLYILIIVFGVIHIHTVSTEWMTHIHLRTTCIEISLFKTPFHFSAAFIVIITCYSII